MRDLPESIIRIPNIGTLDTLYLGTSDPLGPGLDRIAVATAPGMLAVGPRSRPLQGTSKSQRQYSEYLA